MPMTHVTARAMKSASMKMRNEPRNPREASMSTVRNRAAVLGKPIAHSLSPLIHNTAYRALGLGDWNYDSHEVDEAGLRGFIDGLDPSWRGLSLTMPLKKTVMTMGEPCNHWAEKLGVANTAIFDWSGGRDRPRIRLYNTDVAGINLALNHAVSLRGGDLTAVTEPRALVIGSGSTAGSAIAALSTMRVERVTIAARHPEKAHALAPKALSLGMDVDVIGMGQIAGCVTDMRYVVSTLPAHAADAVAEDLDSAGRADAAPLHGALLDVVYSPSPSDLIAVWKARGGLAVGGEEMLLYQAIPQLSYMTGIDIKAMPGNLDVLIRRALGEVLR